MIANRRHSDLLRSRLEEIVYRGYTSIKKYELYAWYDRDRLTQNVFRHIIETFHEISKSKSRLSVLTEEGGYLLVDPGKLQTAMKAFGLNEE
jgi:hypothetical protein